MFNRSKICTALLVAVASNAWAQDTGDSVQRVEITGSSIRRIQSEGALPVNVDQRELSDGNSVLRGQAPRVDRSSGG